MIALRFLMNIVNPFDRIVASEADHYSRVDFVKIAAKPEFEGMCDIYLRRKARILIVHKLPPGIRKNFYGDFSVIVAYNNSLPICRS